MTERARGGVAGTPRARGKLEPLPLSAGQGGEGLAEANVAESDVAQRLADGVRASLAPKNSRASVTDIANTLLMSRPPRWYSSPDAWNRFRSRAHGQEGRYLRPRRADRRPSSRRHRAVAGLARPARGRRPNRLRGYSGRPRRRPLHPDRHLAAYVGAGPAPARRPVSRVVSPVSPRRALAQVRQPAFATPGAVGRFRHAGTPPPPLYPASCKVGPIVRRDLRRSGVRGGRGGERG